MVANVQVEPSMTEVWPNRFLEPPSSRTPAMPPSVEDPLLIVRPKFRAQRRNLRRGTLYRVSLPGKSPLLGLR